MLNPLHATLDTALNRKETITMPFGHPIHAENNRAFSHLAASTRPLIMVHRGSSGGAIAENTLPAFHAALAQGGDIIETDVIRSTDGEYFLFHNGYEQLHFSESRDIRSLSSTDIRALNYTWHRSPKAGPYPVTTAQELFSNMEDSFLTIDRSWDYWPDFLHYLDTHANPHYVLLKAHPTEENLTRLAHHPTKYMFIPIGKTLGELEEVMNTPQINTIAVEILARDASSPLGSAETITMLHERNLLVLLNALNLANGVPLYREWDDITSLLTSPDAGWGKLITQGADIIQTDFPAALRFYRDYVHKLPGSTELG